MLVFTVLLLIMVGAVFVYSPAEILHSIGGDTMMWVVIIFCYYFIATMLPIDKIIGKVYPLFAMSLLFMAGALMVWLFLHWPSLPELWTHCYNMGAATEPDRWTATTTWGLRRSPTGGPTTSSRRSSSPSPAEPFPASTPRRAR